MPDSAPDGTGSTSCRHCCAGGNDETATIAHQTSMVKSHHDSARTPLPFLELGSRQREHTCYIRRSPILAGSNGPTVDEEPVDEEANDLLAFSDDKEDLVEPEDELRHRGETDRFSGFSPPSPLVCSALSSETSTLTCVSQSTLLDSPIIDLSPTGSPLTSPSTPAPPSAPSAEDEEHKEDNWRPLQPSLRDGSSNLLPPNPALVFSAPFTDVEHNRLLGCAVFIESMTALEREEFWREMASESFAHASNTGNHSGRSDVRKVRQGRQGHVAREWERYYQFVVREIYLQRNKLIKGDGAGAKARYQAESGEGPSKEDVGRIEQADVEVPVEHRGEDSEGFYDMAPSKHCPRAEHSSTSSAVAEDVSTSLLDLDIYPSAAEKEMTGEDSKKHGRSEQPVYSRSLSPQPEKTETSSARIIQGLGISRATLIDPMALAPSPAAQPEFRASLRPPPSQPRAFPPSDVSELFYRPTMTSAEDYRTVLVTDIPPATTLAMLLRKLQSYMKIPQRRKTETEIETVREGESEEGTCKKAQGKMVILSASLHSTNSMRTSPPMEGNTARIVFLAADTAAEIVKACHATTATTGDTRSGLWTDERSFGVHLIPTPTRPCSPRLQEEIERGLSRILYLAFPASASHAICGSAHGSIREGDLEVSLDSKRAITTPSPAKPLLESLVTSLSSCGINTPIASGKLDRGDGNQVLWFEFADVRDAGLGWAAVGQWNFAKGEVERGFLGEGEVYDFERERELGVDVEREA